VLLGPAGVKAGRKRVGEIDPMRVYQYFCFNTSLNPTKRLSNREPSLYLLCGKILKNIEKKT